VKGRDVFHLTHNDVSYRARGRTKDGRRPTPTVKNTLTAALTLWRDALCNESPLWDDDDPV
jgi:hypothetical protein